MLVLNQICVFIFMLSLGCSSAASRITFTASPALISPGLSETLHIRCSVEAEAEFHVASIAILRTNEVTGINETIAEVTAFNAATVHEDLEKLQVTGSTNSSLPGENGYLQLNWTNPTTQQHGIYICEVFIFNSVASELSVEEIRVGINQVTTRELLLYIANLESRTENSEKLLTQLVGGNVQTGSVVCIQGSHDYPISFSAPYANVPTVVTVVAGTNDEFGFVYTPSTFFLTETGFTLRCTSHHTTDVVWVAI